jgi:hypothetical protein
MRALFSSLVACSLLIHAALGCSWHHEHDGLCSQEAASEHAVAKCCHHHDGPQEQHDQPSHSPCDGHSHCQGLCSYLPVQKSQLDSDYHSVLLDFAAIAPALCDVQVSGLVCFERSHETAAGPPLRLHLYHQILLI